MRTIIAGSRGIQDDYIVAEAVKASKFEVTTVISGTARGVDKLGEHWAWVNKIPVEQYPANWDKFGISAGYRRNEQMARNADALIAIWDGKSKGTLHMIESARKESLKVFIYNIGERHA
jgi:hypothetical protein